MKYSLGLAIYFNVGRSGIFWREQIMKALKIQSQIREQIASSKENLKIQLEVCNQNRFCKSWNEKA